MTMVLAVLLGIAVTVAIVRLLLRRTRAPAEARAPAVQMALLFALQPLCAVLLYLTLVPPPTGATAGGLVVATRGAGVVAALTTGDRLVALPEAPSLPGAERVPDLGTALRRYAPARVHIIGDGLVARDRDAARGMAITVGTAPLRRGLVHLDLPVAVAAGGVFRVGGRIGGVARPSVDLLDPAGQRVDTATPDASGDFVVSGTARAAGPATFSLRIRDDAHLVETVAVPVWTGDASPQRVSILAGAPGPEVKYLRRWASDAGLALDSELMTGDGLALGDAPAALTLASLARVDVVVLDDRSLATLGSSERAALGAAVRGGLGVVVRMGGPLDAAGRAALRPLGFAVAGDGEMAAITLRTPAVDDAARVARSGPGSPDDPVAVNRGDAVPALTQVTAAVTSSDATPLFRDAKGAPIGLWRADGAGRVALWPLVDSFRLVLAGHSDTYNELWSGVFATVGRGRPGAVPAIDRLAWVGQRVTICATGGDARVVAPDGTTSTPLVDPASQPACAGFWPRASGWHRLEQRIGSTTVATPFFVAAAGAWPNVRATDDAAATRALAARQPIAGRSSASQPGASWPWFLGWLAASAALWWLERAPRRHRQNPAQAVRVGEGAGA